MFQKNGNPNGRIIGKLRGDPLYKEILNHTSYLPESAIFAERIYVILSGNRNICVICNSDTKFITFKRGYRNTCSSKCAANTTGVIAKRNQTKLERYGDANYNNQTKNKQTKLERYGDETYNNQTKNKQTKLERYGEEYYGNPAKGQVTKLERYGDEYFTNRKKAKQTSQERHGVDNWTNREKYKETCLTKYGVDNYFKTEQFLIDTKKTTMEKYGCEWNSQSHISGKSLDFLNSRDWLYGKHIENQLPINAIAQILGVHYKTVSRYLASHEIQVIKFWQSQPEKQISEMIRATHNTIVLSNIRTIIPPKEIDIYLPEHKLAIEFNGIYWHHPDRYGGEDTWFAYHQNKIDSCQKQGIKLLHLWENYGDHPALITNAIINHQVENNLQQVFINLYSQTT